MAAITLSLNSLEDLPNGCGVYIFRHDVQVLYVGKSINLKARIKSHQENAKTDKKEALIINQSNKIDFYLTENEFSALILEANLIKELRPRYNTRWKDNKSYLYIKITRDYLPEVTVVRQENDGNSQYFGPFPSQQIVRNILGEIRKISPFHLGKIGRRPCFYAKLGQCAPCPSQAAQIKDVILKNKLVHQYKRNVRQLAQILDGQLNNFMKKLQSKLNKLKMQPHNYEAALALKNKLDQFEQFLSYGILRNSHIAEYQENQEINFDFLHLISPEFKANRIECYDISNLNFLEATGAMVVATNGHIDTQQYRKFRIKQSHNSDFDMMFEVLQRRAKHQEWPRPDLIVLDGGTPQLRKLQTLIHTWSSNINVIGLAKNPDRIVFLKDQESVYLHPATNHPGFRLLRALRDEAHRFSRKYHRKLRNKNLKNHEA